MSDYQVSQKQYPEYQHQHRISNQPVLGKECNKAKEHHGTEQITAGIRSGCAAWHEMGHHALKDMGTIVADRAFCTEGIDEDQEYSDASNEIDACCSD
jgi:hypothetical protein